MSKERKERTSPGKGGQVQERRPSSTAPQLIPPQYHHAAAIAVIFLSLVLFFHAIVFGGKTFLSVDNIASHSFDTFLKDAKSEGIFPLWNRYIFCGMPSYGSLTVGGNRAFDISGQILNTSIDVLSYFFLTRQVGWVLAFYLIFAVGMYLFTYDKIRDKFAALVAALAATYSMYIIIWVMEGHNTKIAVMAMFPYILFVVERLRHRFSFWLLLVLVLLLHFSFLPSHVQMIFYIYLAISIYLLFFLIKTFIKKKATEEGRETDETGWRGLVRAGLVLAVASAVAFSMDADKYLSVIEYNPYSIRGANPIIPSVQTGEVKTVGGVLDYNYATDWSLGPGEMMTFLIPSWYGFGKLPYKGPLSNNQEWTLSTYFGPQPFTHAPQYMGVVVLVLACIGFWLNRKNAFVQYIGVLIVFSLLVAFGKEFSLVYDLMYKYFPGFNKFRVPSMILVLVQILVPVLAAYGVHSLLSSREKTLATSEEKRWKLVLGGLSVFLLLSLVTRGVFRGIYESFFPPASVAASLARSYGPLPPNVLNEIYSFIFDTVMTDLTVAILLLIGTFGALYLYRKGSLKLVVVSVALLGFMLIDLWRIDSRPMEPQDRKQQEQIFATPPYVSFLQKDSSLYRVLEFENGQPPYNNTLAYWRIESAYGYHGAKMRAYQDIVDVVGLNNPLLYQLMNVKYIITNQPDSSAALGLAFNGPTRKVYTFLSALPRAFFVNRYGVASGLEILNNIANLSFDPRDVAYFVEDPKIQIQPPHPAARAEIVKHDIHELEIQTTTDGTNLLFLSETFYPEGWKAYVDGKETTIYRLNYLFRGVVVPSGIHTLTMKFEPSGFYLGKNLSLAANILVIGSLGFVGFRSWRRKKAPIPYAAVPPKEPAA